MENNTTIIKIKRGIEENLPELNDGELAYTRDEKNLYIGTPDGNEKIFGAKDEELPENIYRMEFATIDLGTTMRFDFEHEAGYDDVSAITVGLIGNEAKNGDIKLVAEAIAEEGIYTHILVNAEIGEDVSTSNVKVSMQAVCRTGIHEMNE